MQIETAEQGLLAADNDTKAGNYFVSNYPPYSFATVARELLSELESKAA